ncbi:MAG: hypothetical protein WCL14_12120 [Bacteroidota bacterium]
MKTIKLLLVAFTFLVSGKLMAQAQEIVVPKFEDEVLVMRILDVVGHTNPVLSISDGGITKFSIDLKSLTYFHEGENIKTLAIILNQLKKMGYEVISSNSAGLQLTTYILQKD